MGQIARQAFRSVWAAMRASLRSRERLLGGVELADRARRQSDWDLAVRTYENYLHKAPRDFGVRVRLVKTLYAAGRLDEAEVCVRALMGLRPERTELETLLADILSSRQASVPAQEYDRFRSSLTIPVAPSFDSLSGQDGVTAFVDAHGKSSGALNRTLESLRRSQAPIDAVIVWSADDRPEGEADLAGVVRISDQEKADSAFAEAKAILLLDAGVILAPEGLAWLRYAVSVTGAVAAYGDDDCGTTSETGLIWSEPAFYGAPHPLDLMTTPRIPAAVFLASGSPRPTGRTDRRQLLLKVFESGPVAHVPLLLATTVGEEAMEISPTPAKQADPPGDRILAIIPTRDESASLAIMINSLIDLAMEPSLLDIVVVDNGSREPETQAFLEDLTRDGRARVLVVDEPFNWSRLNNLAAADAQAPILLFANNDMKMLTHQWDHRLRTSLALGGVGVVGARLTYPSKRIQHVGMALGALGGRPVHEGLGASASDDGPLQRWRRNRPAAAVTGAFMGVRRDVFEAVGGFNADEFAVACNDIDFCLRVRAQGWTVLCAADLELVHWESQSRGHDDTEPKLERARSEFRALERLWGNEARRDPSRNPHWINHETLLFYGLRQPDETLIKSWVRESATAWRSSGPLVQASDVTPMSR